MFNYYKFYIYTYSNCIFEVTVTTLTKASCTDSTTDYYPNDITERMICAAKLGKDACQGDSGGPMIVEVKFATY